MINRIRSLTSLLFFFLSLSLSLSVLLLKDIFNPNAISCSRLYFKSLSFALAMCRYIAEEHHALPEKEKHHQTDHGVKLIRTEEKKMKQQKKTKNLSDAVKDMVENLLELILEKQEQRTRDLLFSSPLLLISPDWLRTGEVVRR